MLTVLETLGPAERAVFVLREVFETPYDEIAEAVGMSPAAVRQIAHRARDHVATRRPRVPVSPTEQQEAVDRFLAAVRHGDVQGSSATPLWLNGSPAIRIDIGGALDTAVSLAVEHGRITRIYAVRNPHKLARLDAVARLARS